MTLVEQLLYTFTF